MTSSESRLRIGFVGLGLAASMAAPAITIMPGAQVVACCDTDKRQLELFAERFGAVPYADYEAMCSSPAVDVIWVATPTVLHCEQSILALNHGKHVIVEKPMAVSLVDASKMIGAAERNSRQLL